MLSLELDQVRLFSLLLPIRSSFADSFCPCLLFLLFSKLLLLHSLASLALLGQIGFELQVSEL